MGDQHRPYHQGEAQDQTIPNDAEHLIKPQEQETTKLTLFTTIRLPARELPPHKILDSPQTGPVLRQINLPLIVSIIPCGTIVIGIPGGVLCGVQGVLVYADLHLCQDLAAGEYS